MLCTFLNTCWYLYKNFIKEGRVTVNGNVAKLGTKVSNEDVVEFDNKVIELKEVDIKLIALNKPEGVLSSTAREKKIPIVYDYLPNYANQRNWISIGRLDINTSGLMLFTNDGSFANYCMHPSNTIDREYLVRARGDFSIEKKNEMLKGIIIDGEKHQFTDVVEGEKEVMEALVKKGMEGAVEIAVPLDIDYKFAKNWLAAH